MLLTVYSVVMRYLVKRPQSWAFDLSIFLQVGILFLGVAYALSEDAHVRIDAVVTRLPKRGRLVLDSITTTVIFLFSALLTVSGVKEALDNLGGISNSTAMLPTFPSYAVIPIGGFLLCLVCISKIRGYLLLLTKREEVQ